MAVSGLALATDVITKRVVPTLEGLIRVGTLAWWLRWLPGDISPHQNVGVNFKFPKGVDRWLCVMT